MLSNNNEQNRQRYRNLGRQLKTTGRKKKRGEHKKNKRIEENFENKKIKKLISLTPQITDNEIYLLPLILTLLINTSKLLFLCNKKKQLRMAQLSSTQNWFFINVKETTLINS